MNESINKSKGLTEHGLKPYPAHGLIWILAGILAWAVVIGAIFFLTY